MNKKTISIKGLLTALMMLVAVPLSLYAQDDEPIITLRTTSPACTIFLGGNADKAYIDVDCGNGPEEKEVVPAVLNPTTGEWTGTSFTCNPVNGLIRIYGEAENIVMLNLDGCYITQADLSKLVNLEFLFMKHNELESLDLSAIHRLKYIEVTDSPMNKGYFRIGKQPELMILSIEQTGNLSPDFTLADYPKLKVFTCWGNPDITEVDPSVCPDLLQLSIDGTSVERLDVSKNEQLQILNISDTRITDIDISKNTLLQEFYCQHESGTVNPDIDITSVDVSNNPNLIRLSLSGNRLTNVDLSANRYLRYINVGNNQLRNIDLSANVNLLEVILSNNYFGFSTLPLPSTEWQTYDYYQRNIPVSKTYCEGAELDLSSMVLREGTVTTAALFAVDEANANALVQLDESYFTFDVQTGKVTLLKATADSVYLAFANDAFPDLKLESLPLRTDKFVVKTAEEYGKDVETLSFTVSSDGEMAFMVGMSGATAETPKTLYVDFGDGSKVPYTVTTESLAAQPNVVGKVQKDRRVVVYVPQDELLTALAIGNVHLQSIDVTRARALRWLRLENTALKAIDLGWNKSLETLTMTGNDFGTLNVAGANYAYNKSLLHDIYLSNNNLTEVTLTDNNYTLHNVDLSHNRLTSVSFKDADMMQTLDLSDNNLTELNVNYCSLMTSLNISGNSISTLVLPTETSLKHLKCEGNRFDFTTLPDLKGLEIFTYAPQQEVVVARKGPGIDLSNQLMDGTTSYRWFDGERQLVSGTDYTEKDGKFVFASFLVGSSVHCLMSNPSFPDLTLMTTPFEVASMPNNLLATFTTKQSQVGKLLLRSTVDNNTVCVDWNGDGTDLVFYNVGTTPQTFDIQTHEGVVAKVYSYEANSHLSVFSISDISLGCLDVSGMKELVGLTVVNAGLQEIVWPQSEDFMELNLTGNDFSTLDLGQHSGNMQMIVLSNNKFKTFDASQYPRLAVLSLFGNGLETITLDNPNLFQLDLGRNKLTSIDLSKVPDMNNLALTENQLSHIDVSSLKWLRALYLDRNRLRFSTLPLDKGYSKYTYANQADIEVAEVNGAVDLSSEAMVDGTETVYRWFVGEPSFDDYGELAGEELELGDEYDVVDGISYIHIKYDGLKCAMTNEKLPNVVLYTTFVNATPVGSIKAAKDSFSVSVDGRDLTVSSLPGSKVSLLDADGRLLDSRDSDGGTVRFRVGMPGIYLVVSDGLAAKVSLK